MPPLPDPAPDRALAGLGTHLAARRSVADPSGAGIDEGMTDRTPAADPSPEETAGFVHLHVHTEFSKQDGLARLRDLTDAVAADGQSAVAMTDHGNIAGAWKFVQACKKAGIKPILGCEIYFALIPDGSDPDQPALAWDDPQVRFARTTQVGMDAESGKKKRNTNNHLTVLVRNEAGWRNLCAITNAAEESFFHKPLVDYALLKKHAEGLVVLTGCLGGPVASHVAAARTDRVETVEVAETGPDGEPTTRTESRVVGHDWDEARLDAARENLRRLIQCVGQENVYVEIMEHGLSAEGRAHIKMLTTLADEAGVPVVATNDCHYVDECDCDAHDSWLVNGERARGNPITKDDPDRWRFNGEGYWLRTEAEMRALYSGRRWQQACDETVRLAERVENEVIPFKPLRLPKFPVPAEVVAQWQDGEETTVADINGVEHPARRVGKRAYRSASALYLHQLVRKGADERYGGVTSGQGRALGLGKRLNFEFDVITGMGLEDYFLIVHDVLAWARSDRGLPTPEHPDGAPNQKRPILVGPGRGSAAGSAVSYCLGIVMVEPLANGLLFERFLDVARIGMPDIDVDFEAARRDEVYDYLAARYGEEYVARIGSFQIAKTKRAIKDAARVYDMPALGEQLSKTVPVHQGSPQKFAQIFDETNAEATDFRALVAANPDAAKIVDLARAFEDVAAGESIHAAGVIISDEPMTNLIPMRHLRDKKTKERVGIPVALWDGKDIDSFGMLKLDALSLTNLDIIAAAVANIETTTGERVDPDLLPHPDDTADPRVEAAFALLRDGKTEGIFQLESSGITELCEAIAPTSFADLSALVALYRPGPMGAGMHHLYADRKNGRSQVDYDYLTRDPAEQAVIAAVLDDTFGVICYQESLMQLAEVVAGFTADEKNRLRKAFSKKDRPAMEALKEVFISQGAQQMTLADGTEKIAFSAATLAELWRTFDASAEYLFNKSHSAAYGYLAYVTAYLKANWPTEYAAGILAVVDKAEKRLATLRALRKDGIAVLAPDVNNSGTGTGPDLGDQNAVRLGLAEIRDVKDNARWIVAERDKNGPFTGIADLMRRVKMPGKDGALTDKLSVTVIEGLVEAGAFDSFGQPRMGLMIALRALSAGVEIDVPDAEWSALERSARQRIRLGVAVGEHPLRAYRDRLADYTFAPVEDRWGNIFGGRPTALHRVAGNQRSVITLGVLTSWAEKTTRKGGKLANFTIEGTQASMSGTAFGEAIATMRRSGVFAQVGDIVAMAGQMKTRTITSTVINDDGDEVEETREVSELIASHIEVIDVDAAPVLCLPEVVEPVRLAKVVDLAQARAERITAERAEQKKAGRKTQAKKTTAATGAKTSATGATANRKATDPDLVDIDEPLDGAGDQPLPLVVVAPAGPDPVATTAPAGGNGTWDAVVRLRNAEPYLGFEYEGERWLVGDQTRDEQALLLTEAYAKKPHDIGFEYERAWMLVVACRCTCAQCVKDCAYHADAEGACTCHCSRGCRMAATNAGRRSLLVATEPGGVDDALLTQIDPEHPAWEPVEDAPGWATAPLAALLPLADDVPAEPDDLTEVA